ncbi:MAG: phosphatidylserine decarboxylase [Gammaproteobacteria bacterium]|nr:phosphatidylserine decarboxylase [Gammaproteobacteria bacterium]
MSNDWLKILPHYLLPQHLLSRLMYVLTRARRRVWKDWQISWFIRRYRVDMSIAEQSDPLAYENFNSFFTRALKAGARPVAAGLNEIVCPVDGAVSQIGGISEGRIIQAKGRDYSLVELLGGSEERAAPFLNGQFATLYLSPKDYHRIHMPVTGRLREMVYVPGRLFSVNALSVRGIPRLFARNERVAAIFDTEIGAMAVVMVGALFVGSIETVWAGTITPPYRSSLQRWNYQTRNIAIERGAELGRFNMGSTVIVLFESGDITWNPTLAAGSAVQMGQALGRLKLSQ